MTQINDFRTSIWVTERETKNATGIAAMDWFVKIRANILGCTNALQLPVCDVMITLYAMRYPTESTLIQCLRQLLQVQKDRLDIIVTHYSPIHKRF